jgi:hypothetical protein
VIIQPAPTLWNGTPVTEALNVESDGELILEDTKGGLFGEATSFLCSGIRDGWVGPESLGAITDVLDLKATKVLINTTPLTEPGFECTNVSGCTTPLVWAVNLPWDTEVELMEEGTEIFFALLILPHAGGGNPGWLTQCMGVIGEPEDECTSVEELAQLLLPTTTTLGWAFEDPFRVLAGIAAVTCTRGGAGTGLAISDGEGTIRHETGGELSVSSEGGGTGME